MAPHETLEGRILHLIREQGPLTGAQLCAAAGEDEIVLWRACRLSEKLQVFTVGRRYLRLDRNVEGFARLSPSIMREFLTYSVIGLRDNLSSIRQKAEQIASHIKEVSRQKEGLARTLLSALLGEFQSGYPLHEHACFIIAGDIVYGMAHDVPRPERSTRKMVKGSDIDLVVVVDDAFPRGFMESLDEMIYKEKQKLIMTPHLREEIDYIVKDLARVRKQLAFDTFKHMLACKILQEGALIYGSENLFNEIKAMLHTRGITEELKRMEHRAHAFRKEAERYLLMEPPEKLKEENRFYFYPAEESEEFE